MSKFSKATPPRRSNCASVVVARSKILDFHPEETYCSQNNAINKDIARYNELRPDI
jgi:hypothetical protein